MVNNQKKEEVCNQYKDYLDIIEVIGNKIMLQQHLIAISIKFNIAKDKFSAIKAIQDLVQAEIIKKTNFGDGTKKFIILKKYAIRFLKKVDSSQKVSAVPKVNTNQKYIENIFKVQVIVNNVIPLMEREKIILNISNLLKFLNSKNCNVLSSKNNIIEFYENNIGKYKSDLNLKKFEEDCYKVKLQQECMLKNLNGEKSMLGGAKRKTTIDFLTESTIATLMRRNIYIGSIVKRNGGYIFSVMYFDLNNSQNVVNIALNYAIIYRFFRDLFPFNPYDENIKIRINICVVNEIAKNNIEKAFYKQTINPATKQIRNEDYLTTLLRRHQVSAVEMQKITFKVLNFKILP